MAARLKLRAVDAEDLSVISACLQDAVVAYRDLCYLPEETRFILVANRFRWEVAPEPPVAGGIYQRVHCGICFDTVKAVKKRGLGKPDPSRILSLLAVTAEGSAVELKFAAGGAIRLEVDRLMCHLEDFDEPWPTQWRPKHPLD